MTEATVWEPTLRPRKPRRTTQQLIAEYSTKRGPELRRLHGLWQAGAKAPPIDDRPPLRRQDDA